MPNTLSVLKAFTKAISCRSCTIKAQKTAVLKAKAALLLVSLILIKFKDIFALPPLTS